MENKDKQIKDTADKAGNPVDKADGVSPPVDKPTESTAEVVKNTSDEVATRIEEFSKKTSASGLNSSNKNKQRRRHKQKNKEKREQISSQTAKTPDTAKVASSTTPTTNNIRTNVQNAVGDDNYYESSGWIEGAFDGDFFNRMIQIFNSLGIDTTNIIDRRGELLRGFKQWVKVNQVWVNGSKPVYVLDMGAVDRSLSSETIWYRLFRQRRPYQYMANGISSVDAHVAPDEIKKFRFLNITTNGQPGNTSRVYSRFATYGILQQNLDANNGNYQNRGLTLADGSEVNSKPGSIVGFRIPATNHNVIAANGTLNQDAADGNTIIQFQVDLSTNDGRTLPYDIGTSVELKNKGATLIKMFAEIKNKSAEYAHNSKDGDNDWYQPISLIEDIETLAATLNGPADLKTFLYIMNDAIKGAFASQFIKATKMGTPDSAYISMTEKSRGIAETFDAAYTAIWESLKAIPMHKDVIEKWNQHKKWSKVRNAPHTDNDNPIVIPYFIIVKTGGGVYNQNSGLEVSNDTDDLHAIDDSPSVGWLSSTLSFTAQTLDRGSVTVPQGDWFQMFVQTVLGKLALSNFIRHGRSNTVYCGGGDCLHSTGTLTNVNQVFPAVIREAQSDTRYNSGNMITSDDGIIYQTDYSSDDNMDPLTNNGSETNIKNNMLVDQGITDYNKSNTFGDFVISYHTMTGFMFAFMERLASAYETGELRAWERLFKNTTNFFARMAKINPSDSSFIFNTPITPVAIANREPMSKDLPQYSVEENVDTFYSTQIWNYDRTGARAGFSYQPTRINYVNDDVWNQYLDFPRKIAGIRSVIIDKNGKADRDITKDNCLATIYINDNDTVSPFNTANHPHNIYLASHSVIRPSSYMSYIQTTGVPNNQLFPITVHEHLGSYIYSELTYMKVGFEVPVGIIQSRMLMCNSSDDVMTSAYYCAWDQLIYSQLLNNVSTICRELPVQINNIEFGTIGSTSIFLETDINIIEFSQLLDKYHNNSDTNIIDHLDETIFRRIAVNSKSDSTVNYQVVPATTFTQL